MREFPGREARLKPEFAHLYPPLEADRWEPAGVVADRMVSWLLRQRDGGYVAPHRVLHPDHFEFRGSLERIPQGGSCTRRDD
jgi:hypothetical protein